MDSNIHYPGWGTSIGCCGNSRHIKKILGKSPLSLNSKTVLASLGSSILFPLILPFELACLCLTGALFFSAYLTKTRHRRKNIFKELPLRHNETPLRLGQWSNHNDVIVSNCVEETYIFKKKLIQSARNSIEISFNFAGGNAFREVLGLIDFQMKEHSSLQTHLLMSPDLLEMQDHMLLQSLKDKHKDRFIYLITKRFVCFTPRPHTEENHVKMTIIDGKYFVLGGSGVHDKMVRDTLPEDLKPSTESFSSKFIDPCFRDTDIIGKGEIVPTMREQYFRLFHIWEYRTTKHRAERFFATDGSKTSCKAIDQSDRLIKNSTLKFLVSGPEHRLNNPITHEITKRIKASKKKIKIANLSFNPGKKIGAALKEKLKEGVGIFGFFNAPSKNTFINHLLYSSLSRCHYKFVSQVYEYIRPHRLYHKKVFLFDDRFAKVGTDNLGTKSRKWDYEAALFFNDERVCKEVKKGLKEDMIHSKVIANCSLASLQKCFWHRLKGQVIKKLIANFFA